MSANDAVTLIRPGSPTPASFGDVPELAAAHIFPQFVPAHLIHEVNVIQSVAIDVRYRDTVAVIVVDPSL